MARVDTERGTDRTHRLDDGETVPGWADWLLGGVLGVVGAALTAVGGWLFVGVDRSRIADAVASESVEVEGLSPSEVVTASGPFVDWLAVGVVATGLVILVGAVAFVRARRRSRRRAAPGEAPVTFWASTVYGAAATALASALPVGAGVVGGGVAAHLLDGDGGWRVGAATGLVWWAPTVPLVVAVAAGLVAGGAAIGDASGGIAVAALLLAGELVGLATNVAFGALGGVLADRFV